MIGSRQRLKMASIISHLYWTGPKVRVVVRPPRDTKAMNLARGWAEVWHHGRCLGLHDCLGCLESWIQRHPGHRFTIRFIQHPIWCPVPALMPICRLSAEAGKRRPHYYHPVRPGKE